MNKVVHGVFCACMAVIAAEPALIQAVPSLVAVGPLALALCSAVCTALHFWDPADASLPVPPKAQ